MVFDHIDRKVSDLVEDSLQHVPLTKDEVCFLLSFSEDSPESKYFTDTVNRFVLEDARATGEIGVQIGVHIGPCLANCNFCSFAVSNAYFTDYRMSEKELEDYLDKVVSEKTVSSVSLMTIHDFDFDSYVQLVERAREILPKSVRLVSNTGDLEDWQAKELRSAGIDSAYHALRLREGIDNHLELMERYRTIQNLRAAKIKVMSGIEPIGPEHTAKEIVNGFFQSFEFGCENCSASAREPVAGTPLFSYGHISFKRLQRIRSALLLGSLGLRERRFYGGVYGGFEKVLCEYSHSPKDLEDRSELGLGRTVAWARAVLKSQGYIKIRCVDGSEEDL